MTARSPSSGRRADRDAIALQIRSPSRQVAVSRHEPLLSPYDWAAAGLTDPIGIGRITACGEA